MESKYLTKEKARTYMHIEESPKRIYFTNEPPHVKKWCEKQLKKK